MSVSNFTVKWMSGFSWKFHYRSAMAHGTIWNSLGMIPSTLWIQDSFIYFLDPRVLATSRSDGWVGITEIIRIWTQVAIDYTVSRLKILLHAPQTRRGGSMRSRSASCFVCHLTITNIECDLHTVYCICCLYQSHALYIYQFPNIIVHTMPLNIGSFETSLCILDTHNGDYYMPFKSFIEIIAHPSLQT